jgi:hypothetical protein
LTRVQADGLAWTATEAASEEQHGQQHWMQQHSAHHQPLPLLLRLQTDRENPCHQALLLLLLLTQLAAPAPPAASAG